MKQLDLQTARESLHEQIELVKKYAVQHAKLTSETREKIFSILQSVEEQEKQVTTVDGYWSLSRHFFQDELRTLLKGDFYHINRALQGADKWFDDQQIPLAQLMQAFPELAELEQQQPGTLFDAARFVRNNYRSLAPSGYTTEYREESQLTDAQGIINIIADYFTNDYTARLTTIINYIPADADRNLVMNTMAQTLEREIPSLVKQCLPEYYTQAMQQAENMKTQSQRFSRRERHRREENIKWPSRHGNDIY